MSAEGKIFFVDTNVLLYTLDSAQGAKFKRSRAWVDALWQGGTGRLSWQVLNEFYSNATGRFKASPSSVRASVEVFALWQPVGFGLGVLHRGWHWMDKAGVPYWDSLILAAAEAAGCSYLLSEDFQEGRKFDSVTVVNPFRSESSDFVRA
jgi:predicted nucleic acid-binding protein